MQVDKLVSPSCLSIVEGQLRRLPGMVGMAADLANHRLWADHHLTLTGARIAAVVTGLGYPARVIGEEAVDQGEARSFNNQPLAGCGTGGCSTGCNATAAAWKELYRRFIGSRQ